MSQKIKTSVEIDGSLSASQIANATTDTDKFLVSDGGTVKYRTGLEVLSDLGITSGTASHVQHQVKAGVAINKGQAVYVTGADGTNMIVGLASNASEATSSKTMGLLNATVSTNGFADVITEGLLAGLNTIGANAGDPVWLGTGGNLIYGLVNKPHAPNHLVFIGIVTRVNANNGEIFVKVQNGFELEELHNVLLTGTQNNQLLAYNSSTGLWENKSIASVLGYTPADDAAVVHLTGNEYIEGEKTFANYTKLRDGLYLYQGSSSLTHTSNYTTINGIVNGYAVKPTASTTAEFYFTNNATRSYTYPNANGTFALTSDLALLVPYTGATSSVNLGANDITASAFIKTGGNSTQYLKADGSVSTAMNSRVEVNFIATAGQTTFTTPYEVGQVEVYYNGSKLYPDEFVATNGSTIVLVAPATLNAQISIVKYVSSFNTTSIRTESVFTTTSGQTTFAVNYAIGQVDVFYNGSKLSPAEFTATDGTSVVLGFACAAGESIVIDSFVNQVSGAVGTNNRIAKFTGIASLGDSQIYENGNNIGIGSTPSAWSGFSALQLQNGSLFSDPTSLRSIMNGYYNGSAWIYSTTNAATRYEQLNGIHRWFNAPTGTAGNGITFTQAMTLDGSGKLGIGTPNPGYGLDVQGLSSTSAYLNITKTGYASAFLQAYDNGVYMGSSNNYPLVLSANNSERMRITTAGNLTFNGSNVPSGLVQEVSGNTPLLGMDVNFRPTSLINTTYPGAQVRVDMRTSQPPFSFLYRPAGSAVDSSFMQIRNTGNVLIGTESDNGYKLNISGSMYCSGPAKFGATGEAPTIGGYTNDYSGSFSTLTSNNHGDFTFGSNLTILSDHTLNTTNSHGLMKGAAIVLGGNGYTNGTNSISFFAQPASATTAGTIVSPSAARMILTNDGNLLLATGTNNGFRLKVEGASWLNGATYLPYVYGNISGGSANVYISSSGEIARATSSRKYKKNIQDYTKGLDDIMQMRPVTYNSINETEEGVLYAGLIAEEIHDLGLTEFVQYADDGTPDALAYSNMVALLVKGIQQLKAEIEILKNK